MPNAPDLARWSSRARTRNGVEIGIRPLRPDDRDREVAFINSLSERTRYFRLMAPMKFLPPHLLEQLMDVDYRRRMAFVATMERGGAEEFLGIARYGETDQPGTVELGITVTDRWQGCGIASLLVTELMRFACRRGYRRISGTVLPDNHQMLALAKSLGFSTTYDPLAHIVQISRDLGPGNACALRETPG